MSQCFFFFPSAKGFVIIWVRFAFSRLVYSQCLIVLIYLSMKEDSLFCFVFMRFIEPGCFRSCSLCLSKAFDEEGCMGLVPGRLDFWYKSSSILNDFFTKNLIKS